MNPTQGIHALKAQALRRDIINMVYRAGSGHLGGSLSAVEILVALYDIILNICPDEPQWPERDRFILSKGHAAPALYAILADKGYFPKQALDSLRQWGSILQGHPDMKKTPGVDFSSGSLGQGLSVGLGMALGLKRKGSSARVYVLLGDGELNEGQNWEAALVAAKYKVDNLTAIIDRNRVQLDGTSDCILPLTSLEAKWKAFNWHVLTADGHCTEDIAGKLQGAIMQKGSPTVILAETVKGKGVPFMENDHLWHGQTLNEVHYSLALEAIENGGKRG